VSIQERIAIARGGICALSGVFAVVFFVAGEASTGAFFGGVALGLLTLILTGGRR
jgi:hypothetical protein